MKLAVRQKFHLPKLCTKLGQMLPRRSCLSGWNYLANYDKWKCAGIRSSNGSTRSSALTKKAVTVIISMYLDTLSTKKSLDQVMNKMRYVEKKFKEAEDFLRNTSEGLTSNDKKLGITKIQEKVISICPFYFQVKSFMSETVSINLPYIGKTGMEENITDVLFGSPTATPAYGSAHKGEPYDNDNDENSSSDEEAPFDGDITGEEEPLEENISEGNDSLTTPLHKLLPSLIGLQVQVFLHIIMIFSF